MFRVLTATALLGSLVLTAGCNRTPANYEVIFEVTGIQGTVVTTHPGDAAFTEDETTLPLKRGYVIEHADAKKGVFSVQATPIKGAVTCRLVIEGKQVAKKVGKDGESVTCAADIIKVTA